MNIYQIVSPFTATIYGDSFKEAVKRYIKLNRNININHMIVTDQNSHMRANIRYFNQDGRNKVGINMFPVDPLVGMAPINVIKSKNGNSYLPQNIVQTPVMPLPVLPVAATTFTSPGSAVPLVQQTLTPLIRPQIVSSNTSQSVLSPQINQIISDTVAKATNTTNTTTPDTDKYTLSAIMAPFPFYNQVIPLHRSVGS